MGFFTVFKFPDEATVLPSQSLSGWDGVFHDGFLVPEASDPEVRSQSLSGWDGVFHTSFFTEPVWVITFKSQSLSGWDGVFHPIFRLAREMGLSPRSQSLSGWDGVFHGSSGASAGNLVAHCRNPFQGGMGFFTFCANIRLWKW